MHAVPERVGTEDPPDTPSAPTTYDAFLSYTHDDRPVATSVQKALHRIGRRVGQLRALRLFRDDTNLEASPDLWGKITAAMHESKSMIVVLSPKAADSKWVNAEVSYWLQQRNGPLPQLVLAGGRLNWDAARKCFDAASDSAPPVLKEPGSLPVEPFFIDVSGDGPPWNHTGALFRDKMTALAAPLHGKNKDELVGDDLREQRRFRRLRAAAVAALAILAVVAIVAGGIAMVQRRAAIDQRDEAVAARLTAEARSMLDDSTPGNDVQAFQQILAARTITAHPDDGMLYNAVVAKSNIVKVFDTGAPAYGGATSPDRKKIVTGGAGNDVHIWDLETGEPVGSPLVGHTDIVSAAAWSSDGHTIATSSADKTIRLWDADTGKQIGQPGLHDGVVTTVAFSPDGRLVASAGADAKVRLWDVSDTGPQPVATLEGHYGELRGVAFSPNGARLASVGSDGVVKLWDVATRQAIPTQFQQQFTMFYGVTWAPDSVTLATSGWDGLIRLWNADTGEQLGQLAGHRAGVINAFFTPDSKWVISGSFDKTVRLWDVATMKQFGDPMTGWDGGVAVTVAAGGRIAAVSNDHTIRVLDIIKGQPLASHSSLVSAISFSPDRDLFASSSWDGTVALWSAKTNLLSRAVTGQGVAATIVVFGPDGRLVVSRLNQTVEVWDVDEPEAPGRLIQPCWPMGSMAISPDGKTLAISCASNEKVQLWDLTRDTFADPVEIPDPRGPVGSIAFSPDNSRFATASGKTVQVWDVAKRAPIGPPMTGHEEFLNGISFGPKGDRLVTSAGDNTMHLWDVETGKSIAQTPPQGNAVTAVDYSSDGVHVVSGSLDGTVQLWSVAGDRLTPLGAPITRHKGMVSAIDFSPDGKRFVSGSTDMMLRSWPVDASPDDLCAKLSANMTPDQWGNWVSPDIPYRKPCPKLP